MKFTKSKLYAAIMIAGLVAFVLPAHAQVTSTRVVTALTNVITCQATSTNLSGSQLITNSISQGKNLGIGVYYVGGSATNTGNIGFRFKIIFGGTNALKTTTVPFTVVSTANGTTAVADWGVLPNYTLGPADKIVFAGITNDIANVNPVAAGSIIVSNVFLQWGN